MGGQGVGGEGHGVNETNEQNTNITQIKNNKRTTQLLIRLKNEAKEYNQKQENDKTTHAKTNQKQQIKHERNKRNNKDANTKPNTKQKP